MIVGVIRWPRGPRYWFGCVGRFEGCDHRCRLFGRRCLLWFRCCVSTRAGSTSCHWKNWYLVLRLMHDHVAVLVDYTDTCVCSLKYVVFVMVELLHETQPKFHLIVV